MERFYLPYFTLRLKFPGFDAALENGTRDQHLHAVDGPCWSGSASKRAFDFLVALIALLLLLPVLLLAAIAVKLSSRGPILFRQARMGKNGQKFVIFKFRTMRVQNAGAGPSVTRAGDSRLTSIGSRMRRWKIDELPQLWNVLKGDMSLVGSRPKVPRHQIHPLQYRPGITGAASLAFRNEEHILHRVAHDALDEYQVHVLMPLKGKIDSNYMHRATFLSDLRILFATAFGRGERIDHDSLSEFQDSLLSLDLALRVRFTGGTSPSENVRTRQLASF
jgi:lipopolysaccharide/colanic/teichoic acid biosynthesis glycosyltransferase